MMEIDFLSQLKKEIPDPHVEMDFIIKMFDLEKVNEFFLFLKENNTKGGFFSNLDSQRIASRHIYECMVYINYIVKEINVSRETSILDAGSGPGLPGYLLYCLKENPRLYLLDSSKRRLQFLEKFTTTKNYTNIHFIYSRVEEWKIQYDIAITRALIPFPFNAVLLRHTFKNYLSIFAGKLEINFEQVEYLKQHNLKIINVIRLKELNFLGERNLILLSLIDTQKKMKSINWKTLRREMNELYNSYS